MINKNGILSSEYITDCDSENQLINAEKYTSSDPYVISGSKSDLYVITDMYTRVTPNSTYYFCCETDSEWSDGHGYTEARKGKATIWLYLLKEYNSSSNGYDSPICFTSVSSNKIKNGVWKYKIPDGYNMARVRFNTYSDGEETVTCKFWDVKLIPEKYYVDFTPPHSSIFQDWFRFYFSKGLLRSITSRKEVL